LYRPRGQLKPPQGQPSICRASSSPRVPQRTLARPSGVPPSIAMGRATRPSFPAATPLSPERIGHQFTVSERWQRQLARLKELTATQIPSGDTVDALEYAMDLA